MPAAACPDATRTCSTPSVAWSRRNCCGSRTCSTCTCAPVAMPPTCSRRRPNWPMSPIPWACLAWAWPARWYCSSAMRSMRSPAASSPPARAPCWTSPARCSTSTPRWTTRFRAWARRARMPATRPPPPRRGARWKCWRTRRSPTSAPRASTSSPLSRPTGTTSAWSTCPACCRRCPAHCASWTCCHRPITWRACAATSPPNCCSVGACPAAASSTRWPMRWPAWSTTWKPCATVGPTASRSWRSHGPAWRTCTTGRCPTKPRPRCRRSRWQWPNRPSPASRLPPPS